MSNYIFNINQDTDCVVNINKLQEYKQGIRGNFRVQKNPNKAQDVETSKIYIDYQDYYIGQADQQGNLKYILSSSSPNDVMQVKETTDVFDFEFSLEGQKKKYKIINRTRFTEQGIISLGFDFEHCKVKKEGDVLIYGPEGETPQIPLLSYLENNVISFNNTFSIIPDGDNKLKNINCQNAQFVITSSCQNVSMGENSQGIVLGKRCGRYDGQIKISDNCKNIKLGDDNGVNGNIIIEKNCENIITNEECGKQGFLIIQQSSGINNGKIEFGKQCANQGTIIIEKNCGNNGLLSFGCGDSQSLIGQSFTVQEGVKNGVFVFNK